MHKLLVAVFAAIITIAVLPADELVPAGGYSRAHAMAIAD